MRSYREECVIAKTNRRDPAGAGDVSRKRPAKKLGDFVVEHRGGPFRSNKDEWHKWRSYPTLKIAQEALAGFQRKYAFWEWRIKPEEEHENN